MIVSYFPLSISQFSQANHRLAYNSFKANSLIPMIRPLKTVSIKQSPFYHHARKTWNLLIEFSFFLQQLGMSCNGCGWKMTGFAENIAAFTKVTRINSTDYEIKLVDTAGQDEYSIFPTQYSMDFHGYVLVYSITSQKSFEVIQIIHEKLLDVMGKTQ